MTDILLANATLLDPSGGADKPGAILVRDGLIADIAAGAAPGTPAGAKRIDCAGRVLSPGLIDLRAFVGEPGAEHRETLASASAAAAAGGVTTLVCMPDTNPIMDGPAIVDFVLRRARDTACVNVLPAVPKEGAIAYVSGAAVPKNAPNKANGLAYLNAMLDPRAQVGFAQSMSYAPTVDNAPVPAPLMAEIGFTDAQTANMKYPDFEYLAKNTAPLLDFYRGQGKLRSVDGMAPVEAVTAQVAAVLDGVPA